uniref:Mitochondrial glycoprotein n=1 Tax=Ananas comosus var. bracteatus TaxID=296719 RepID=A0A6V7PM62_ANACO|nr:unnamed protein product [Ananas comosus var. bracteatus]
MARFLRFSANPLRLILPSPQNPNPSSSLLKTLTPSRRPLLLLSTRSFLSDPGPSPSAFDDRLLRLLRSEISYLAGHLPALRPPIDSGPSSSRTAQGSSGSGSGVPMAPTRLKSTPPCSDGAAAVPDEPLFKRVEAHERGPRLHISLVVEVSRGGGGDEGQGRARCLSSSAPLGPTPSSSTRCFRSGRRALRCGPTWAAISSETHDPKLELDAGDRRSVVAYLEERGVDDELAEFLHEYMVNKDKSELLRWLRIVESYVQK